MNIKAWKCIFGHTPELDASWRIGRRENFSHEIWVTKCKGCQRPITDSRNGYRLVGQREQNFYDIKKFYGES